MEPIGPHVFDSPLARAFVHDVTCALGVLATNDPTEWPLHTVNEVRRAISIEGGLDRLAKRVRPLAELTSEQAMALVGIAVTVGAPVSLEWKQRAWEAAMHDAFRVSIPNRMRELEHFQALVIGYDGTPVSIHGRYHGSQSE